MSVLPRACWAAPLLVLAAPAGAQAPAEIPSVLVTAPAPSLTVPSNEQARVRAWLSPGNNTVVPASDFQDRAGATTLRDVLEFVPGVFTQPKWGEDSRLSIRGSGVARSFHLRGVRLYQDGIPVNQADGSGDFQELDPLTFQRVEVFRGGNAFALGANTLGGAINFVTPTGRDRQGSMVRLEAGSFGLFRGQLAHGVVSGPFDGAISITGARQDGYRRHSGGDSARVNMNLGWRVNDDIETRLFFTYNSIRQDIPGALTRAQALSNPRQAAAANLALRYARNIESLRIGSRTAVRLGEGGLLEFGGSYVHRRLDHPIFQVIDNRNDDVNLFARVTLDGRIGGLRNRVVMGVNAAMGDVDNRRFVNLSGRRGALTFSARETATTLDAYVENSLYVLDNLALVTGISGGQARRESSNRLNPALSGSGDWSFANPRLGVMWQATPGLQAYGNVTWSTEPPTLSDLVSLVPLGGFQQLKPQRATTIELGVRGEVGPVNIEAAIWHAWLRNEIQLFQGPTAGSSFARNAGRTLHQGAELAATWRAAQSLFTAQDSVVLRGAYSFSDFRFDGDPTYRDNRLPGVPRHVLRAEARYNHPAGWWVAPNLDYVPEGLFVDNANTTRTNSYALMGLRAGFELPERGISVFVEGRNLLDRRYISSASVTPVATASSALFEPGFGRAVFAGTTFRF